ncbi:MAG: hypothetical protein K2J80_00310 [Oscillospiraceae bacterium]|nr:hypothetical protein [Oscillospiraceae bacterium]
MRKLRKLLGVLLGISIIGTVAVTGSADSVVVIVDEFAKTKYIPICTEEDEQFTGFTDRDEVVVLQDEKTQTLDLTALTPTEHNEYANGDFYIVEDIYVQTDDPMSASVSAADEWVNRTVTVKHLIYDDPKKNYGTLYATMVLTVKFEYNGTTARVVGIPDYCTYCDSSFGLDISTKEVTYKSDQGSNFWGNKYACAEYVVNISNFPKSLNSSNTTSKDFRLYVSMDRNGTMHTYD